MQQAFRDQNHVGVRTTNRSDQRRAAQSVGRNKRSTTSFVRLRESHAIHRRRWIWELLQNAADGQEQFLEVSRYLLEVKSTSVPFARMTLRQGEEAVKPENQERYVLCVVEITDGEVNEEVVREKARFVFGIGALVESKVSDARGLKDLEQELRPGGGAVEIDIVE